MKHFSFHNINRWVTFVTSFYFLSVVCLLFSSFNDKYSFFKPFGQLAQAAELSEDSISNAIPIIRDSLYQNTFSPNTKHYYCLYSGTKKESILITVQSKKNISLSFQLYDSSGKKISPASYNFLSSGKEIQLYYSFSSKESYLFALTSLSEDKISYTIQYTSPKKEKASTTKQLKNSTNTTTSKQRNKKTNTRNTSNSKKNNATSSSNSIAKQTNNMTTSKQTKNISNPKQTKGASDSKKKASSKKKKNITVKKLTLSHTFLQISKGKMASLTASFFPGKSKRKCEWSVSDSSILWIKSKNKTGISIKGGKKGTAMITCKVSGKKILSASCIVKIV